MASGVHIWLQFKSIRSIVWKRSESEVVQLCPTIGDPMDYSLPRSSVHGIFQARIVEWAAISFSRVSSPCRDRTQVSCIADRRFCRLSHWSEVKWSEVAQSCLTLCDPTDCSLPGSSIRGILQARILEWAVTREAQLVGLKVLPAFLAIIKTRVFISPMDWGRDQHMMHHC